MNFRKNDRVILHIEDIGSGGEGIGHAEGYTLFVKDAVVGDELSAHITKVKKQYGYARVERVLSPSPFRREAPCPEHSRCGGCQIQAMTYESQLKFKEDRVRACFMRIGGFSEADMERVMQPIIGCGHEFRYRNKAQYPVGKDRAGRTVAGFYAGRTHSIIPCGDCLLGVPENRAVLDAVIAYMEECGVEPYDEESGSGDVRHILIRKGFATGEIMVCIVANADSLRSEERLVERLSRIPGMTSVSLNVNRLRNNVIMGDTLRVLWGREYIYDTIGGVRFAISPLSFYQVNPEQTEKLYGKALEYAALTGDETVWDLYCGIGTISLFLAQKAGKVLGVEVIPEAIRDARNNAKLNGLDNTEFFVGKAEEVLPAYYETHTEHTHPDVIVVDPPRKGCDEVCLDTMLKMAPGRIVYVSCDPATLARDVRILCDGGYVLREVTPVDQFPQSVHVEVVSLMSRV